MTTIQSPDHLLQHLAKKGDPSAFYTLVEPCARKTYTTIRSAGKSHKEAMSLLVPFLKKLYRDFPKKPSDRDFVSWYSDFQSKHLDEHPEPGQDTAEAMLPDPVPVSDLSHLDSQMKLLFMRNYGKVREQRKGVSGKIRFGLLRSNLLVRWTLLLLLCCAAYTGFHVYLTLSHFQVTITIGAASFHHTLTLPDVINKRIFNRAVIPTPSAIVRPASIQPDSLLMNTGKPSDTTGKIPAAKKNIVARSHSHSADYSNDFQKPAKSFPTQKVNPDSFVPASATAGTGYSGQSSAQYIPKPKPAIEKAPSTPQSGKQRTSSSDSLSVFR